MGAAEHIVLLPAYRSLFRALCARAMPPIETAGDRGVVIGIAGESGSGKSVTAKGLTRELEERGMEVRVLHQDDYFVLPPRANHQRRCESLANVGPHEVNLALMQSHVAAFRSRIDGVVGPKVDYSTDSFGTRTLDFGDVQALIVEGTYVLTLDDLDLRIFLDATHEDTRARRRARNRDIDAPIIDRILEIEHRIIAKQAGKAQVVIDREYSIVDRNAAPS